MTELEGQTDIQFLARVILTLLGVRVHRVPPRRDARRHSFPDVRQEVFHAICMG